MWFVEHRELIKDPNHKRPEVKYQSSVLGFACDERKQVRNAPAIMKHSRSHIWSWRDLICEDRCLTTPSRSDKDADNHLSFESRINHVQLVMLLL